MLTPLLYFISFLCPFLQSFRIVDSKPFGWLLQYQCPATKDSDMPHRTKFTEEIIEKANIVIKHAKEEFAVCLTIIFFFKMLIFPFLEHS